MLKTTSCGSLTSKDAGQTATLAGWVHRRRDHGSLIFIDIRDRDGLTQVVFNPEVAPDAHSVAERFRGEWVIQVTGDVSLRPEGTENPSMATGEVELIATNAAVLNESITPPFYINEETEVDELLRMRYRYLDLRRSSMRDTMILRHRVVKFMRDFLDERGFLEIETPILIKSTPEGARDYLVPSRLYHGSFYALPQSPQQLKQLLMVAGVEKYFQIARCFRDEDPRADRQPEFTQLDLEMSFVEQEDILDLTERLYTELIEAITPEKRLTKPFPRLTYREAMDKYGSDKPDLRYGMEMANLNDFAQTTEFRVFTSTVENGGVIKGFAAPGIASYSRRQTDALIEFARARGAAGLVTIALQGEAGPLDTLAEDNIRSAASRFLSVAQIKEIGERVNARIGDMILIVAGPEKTTNATLGALRHELGARLELADPDEIKLAFVVDFPLFEYDEERESWDASHHAFTSPKPGFERYIESDPGRGFRCGYGRL